MPCQDVGIKLNLSLDLYLRLWLLAELPPRRI
jgi:hypothetical protein